ncbi:MAG: hypothetical protein WAL09_17770, partial [Pseudolabrys sp.]
AEDDADKDTHGENSWFPTSNAADRGEFPAFLHGLGPVVTAMATDLGSSTVNLVPPPITL